MKITYDTETDIVPIRLDDYQIDQGNELMAGVIVDVDAKGRAIDFEILEASTLIAKPNSVELNVVSRPVATPKKNRKNWRFSIL